MNNELQDIHNKLDLNKVQVFIMAIALVGSLIGGIIAFSTNLATIASEHHEVLTKLERIEVALTANQLQITSMQIQIVKMQCRLDNNKC